MQSATALLLHIVHNYNGFHCQRQQVVSLFVVKDYQSCKVLPPLLLNGSF